MQWLVIGSLSLTVLFFLPVLKLGINQLLSQHLSTTCCTTSVCHKVSLGQLGACASDSGNLGKHIFGSEKLYCISWQRNFSAKNVFLVFLYTPAKALWEQMCVLLNVCADFRVIVPCLPEITFHYNRKSLLYVYQCAQSTFLFSI